jgi:signal transduction histidine kinase
VNSTIDPASELFKQHVLGNVKKFAEISVKVFNSMLASDYVIGTSEIPNEGISIAENKVVVSIMFTGMVYGEYILVLNEDVASKLLVQASGAPADPKKTITQTRSEIADTFSELLNIIVGESVVELGTVFKKLTITAPKVLFGQANYPKVRAGKSMLASSFGNIDCYLYVDRMKLDIASSYKDAMSSLVLANTELKNAMVKLQEQQALMIHAEKMGALGTMAAGVAHEINTPLATISILGGQLKDLAGEETDFDKKSFIDMIDLIEGTIFRISKITNSLRTFAQGIMGEAPSIKVISDIVEDALVLSEQKLEEKGIRVQKNIANIPVECRPSEICQVILNLISNASDAISALPVKWIKIDTVDCGDALEIRVTDSGASIALDVQKKIFDPFFTTKAFGAGTGLGLSVAKGLIEGHGGTITLDTTSPNTCFVIRLFKAIKTKAA